MKSRHSEHVERKVISKVEVEKDPHWYSVREDPPTGVPLDVIVQIKGSTSTWIKCGFRWNGTYWVTRGGTPTRSYVLYWYKEDEEEE